jgi:hypothetical protein
MRRREFSAGLGGAAAWPLGAHAQAPQRTTIGFLSSCSPRASAPFAGAYYQGMRELSTAANMDDWPDDATVPSFGRDLTLRS